MRVIREITVGDKSVQIRELTVAEIRQWLAALETRNDLVDSMLFEEVSLPDLTLITSLTSADLDAMVPSDIEKVFAEVKGLNPRFFAMREKLVVAGMQMAQMQMAQMQGQAEAPALNSLSQP